MKQVPETIRRVPYKFRALTSLSQTEYDRLLRTFSSYCEEKLSLFTLKGSRRKARVHKERSDSSLYGSEAKLDFLLMYMKEDTGQLRHGLLFEMSQSKVSEWLHFLLPVLECSLRSLNMLPQEGYSYTAEQEESAWFSGDVTERPIARNKDYVAQKEEYGGKKKCHTVKNLVLCDDKNRIVFLSDLHEGKVHDKTIWDTLTIDLQGCNVLLDLGFYGTDTIEAVLPFKKAKHAALTDSQRTVNKALARLRVGVEHAFAGIKRLKIVQHRIRLKATQIRQQVFIVAVGLYNLRLETSLQNKT